MVHPQLLFNLVILMRLSVPELLRCFARLESLQIEKKMKLMVVSWDLGLKGFLSFHTYAVLYQCTG